MSYPEYYDILQVKTNASISEIKRAYRALAKKLHPDLNKNNPKSEELLKKVNEAYSVLKDEKKRAEYDYFGKQAQEAMRSYTQDTTQRDKPEKKTSDTTVPSSKVKYKSVRFLINKFILVLLMILYGWLFYINTDKNEPYNVFKTLINMSDYLIEKIPEKTRIGINKVNEWYNNSILPEKVAFYLVKKGDVNLAKKYSFLLDTKLYDSSNNMYSLLMSSPNPDMTEYLLTLPHDVSYKAKDGANALFTAIKRGDAESVKLLLQAGALVKDLPDQHWLKYTTNGIIIDLLNEYVIKQDDDMISMEAGHTYVVKKNGITYTIEVNGKAIDNEVNYPKKGPVSED